MFPDEESRRSAIAAIERGMMPRSIKDVLFFIAVVIVFFFVPWLVADFLASLLPPMGAWNKRLTWALAILGYTVLVYLAIRRDMPKALRGQLIKAGVPICVKCGYDLRGLPADRVKCPECGRAFDEEVVQLIRAAASSADSPS